MLNQIDKHKIKLLWNGDQFRAINNLCEELIVRWNLESPYGQTEFEYLKYCVEKEGKKQGLSILLKEIEKIAQEIKI